MRRWTDALYGCVGGLCLGYYGLFAAAYGFGVSFGWIWPLVGGLCLGRFSLCALARRLEWRALPAWLTHLGNGLAVAALALFIAVEAMILPSAFARCPDGLDVILVLGGPVEEGAPGGALAARIDAAAGYLQRNPGARAIATGAANQGKVSEARLIRNGLTAAGIDPGRVALEERATTTHENMQFCRAMLSESEGRRVGIVTSEFHAFRAAALARGAGFEGVHALPARAHDLLWPHFWVREALVTVVDAARGHMNFFTIS